MVNVCYDIEWMFKWQWVYFYYKINYTYQTYPNIKIVKILQEFYCRKISLKWEWCDTQWDLLNENAQWADKMWKQPHCHWQNEVMLFRVKTLYDEQHFFNDTILKTRDTLGCAADTTVCMMLTRSSLYTGKFILIMSYLFSSDF